VVLALVIGATSAVLRVRVLADADDLRIGPWRASSLTGSTQADPELRAVVAVNAILALNRQEAIYFYARTDDEGRPLSGACHYRVTGSDLPARWWSLTAYGADHFLIPSPAHQYSVTRNRVDRDENGVFSVAVSQDPAPGNAIATGPGSFGLTLRAYQPDSSLLSATPAVSLPRIQREHCR